MRRAGRRVMLCRCRRFEAEDGTDRANTAVHYSGGGGGNGYGDEDD